MSDGFWYAFFFGMPGIISAAIGAYVAVRQNRVIHNTNSLVDQLIDSTGKAEYKRGVSDEKRRPTP
jgi:hypothetical protein